MRHFFFTADEQFARSFGTRLIGKMMAAQQRKADRQVMDVLANLPNKYRNDFVTELERRLLGQ